MKTQPSPKVVGSLITSYLSTPSDRDFSKILKHFTPYITVIAGTFPKDWKEDYIQEGTIGLYNALKSCRPDMPIPELLRYASRSIKSKMIDFYRSTVGRFLIDVDVYLEDGSCITAKQPCIIYYPENFDEEEDEVSPIERYSSLPEYASTVECSIDLKYLLDDKQLQQLNLTESEIRAIDLHYKQDFNTTTISKFLHTSVSNASKLISKANTKVKPYILKYYLN